MSYKLMQQWAKHWQDKKLPPACVDCLVKQYKKWRGLSEPAQICSDKQLQLWQQSVFAKINQDQFQREPQLVKAHSKLNSAQDSLTNGQSMLEQARASGASQASIARAQEAVDSFSSQQQAAKRSLLVFYRKYANRYLRTMFRTWADVLRHDGFVWRLSTFHNSLCRPTAEECGDASAADGTASQSVLTQAGSQADASLDESSSSTPAADGAADPKQHSLPTQAKAGTDAPLHEASGSEYASHSTDFDRFEDFMDASGFRRHFLRMAKTEGELQMFLKSVLLEAADTFAQLGVQYVEFSVNPNDLNDWKHVLLEVVQQVEARYPVIIRFLCAFNRVRYVDADVAAMKAASYAEFLSKIQPPQGQRDTWMQSALEGLGTLQLAIPYLGNLVVGLDVLGAENSGAYIPLVDPEFAAFIQQQQRSNPNFGCRFHAGEAWDDEWKGKGLLAALHAIKVLRQSAVKVRIGHGVELAALVQQSEAFGSGLPFYSVQDLYSFLREHEVVTELCLVSNMMLKQSPRERQTPAFLGLLQNFDLPYTFGSDNSSLFEGVPAISELFRLLDSQGVAYEQRRRLADSPHFAVDQDSLAQTYGMSCTEIAKGHRWGVTAAFTSL